MKQNKNFGGPSPGISPNVASMSGQLDGLENRDVQGLRQQSRRSDYDPRARDQEMQPGEGYNRPPGQHSVQAELDRRQSSRLRRIPGGGLSTDKHMDKLDKSPRLRSRARVSVISGGGSTGSPFKKVRSDVNLDRADSPDVAKRLSRPRFDQLNADEQIAHGLPRVQTVQFGEDPTALDAQREVRVSPMHSESGLDGGLSQAPSYSL